MSGMAQTVRRDNGALITALIFVPPAVLLFTIFVILPLGEAAWFSLFKWNGLGWPSEFIGLKNYVRLLDNADFRTAFINNLLIIVFSIAVQLPLGLGMALLLARRANNKAMPSPSGNCTAMEKMMMSRLLMKAVRKSALSRSRT